MARELERVLEGLERYGLLLQADARLPSVATIVAGEPVRGSWWGHPRSHDIYDGCEQLEDHPDVATARLISGKVTYVQRRLWLALAAVGCARERWQTEGLSEVARRLLEGVRESGEMRTDEVPWTGGMKPGETARELERRLLLQGEEFHTASGAHAKRLQTWERWAERVGLALGGMTAEEGKRRLEEALAELNEQSEGKGKLPWQ